MEDQIESAAARGDLSTPDQPPRSPSIVPGIMITALLLGGVGMFVYAEWRRAYPAPDIPEGVEPMLKVPGDVPKALRKPNIELGAPR